MVNPTRITLAAVTSDVVIPDILPSASRIALSFEFARYALDIQIGLT